MREIANGFWEINMPEHRVLGMAVGRRMTIARLADNSLLLHSPIKPTADLVAAVNRLGPVSCIIGANTFHDAFLVDAQQTWPASRLHGAPGLAEANGKLRVHEVLGASPSPLWSNVLDQHLIQGMPKVNEVVFLHRQSRTLIIADLAFHLVDTPGTLGRLLVKAYGMHNRFGPSPLFKSMIRDRAALRASLEQVLSWDFDRVLVGHGAPLETGGKTALRQAYGFLWS